MREFRGSRLPANGRRLYAAFLGFVLLGFAVSLALYWDSLGLNGAAEHYLGNADDPDATEILIEMSPRELLEVSHFHLFTMPVLLLVLGHVFLLARGGAWKQRVVGLACASTLLHLAGPWIVRFGGPAWVMPASALPFVGSYVFMAVWPLPELLFPELRSAPVGRALREVAGPGHRHAGAHGGVRSFEACLVRPIPGSQRREAGQVGPGGVPVDRQEPRIAAVRGDVGAFRRWPASRRPGGPGRSRAGRAGSPPFQPVRQVPGLPPHCEDDGVHGPVGFVEDQGPIWEPDPEDGRHGGHDTDASIDPVHQERSPCSRRTSSSTSPAGRSGHTVGTYGFGHVYLAIVTRAVGVRQRVAAEVLGEARATPPMHAYDSSR